MRIDAIPEWALTAADEAALVALIAASFPTGFGGRSFFHQRHHLRLIARDPGIVGHMALGYRAIRLGGRLHDVVTLAEVASDPGRRGEGIAQALLAEAVAQARASRAAFFLLFGGARLYEAAGFRPAENPMTWVEMGGAVTRGVKVAASDSLMVLALAAEPWPDGAPLDLLGHLF